VASGRALRRWRSSITVRILASFILLMSIATMVSVIVVRQLLLASLDDRIDDDLVQETRELTRLIELGVDPETGEPFGSNVRRVLDVFLERNVPARNEFFLTFVEGELYRASRNEPPYDLSTDPVLLDRWGSIGGTDAGAIQTPDGLVRYLAVPIEDGDEIRAVFVAAVFRDLEADVIGQAVRAAALVGVAALLIGSTLAFFLARRILRPVQEVEAAARTISESDLSRRLDVRGDDEIAHLAGTFNDLLERLERAFVAQRAFVDDAGHELRTPITIVRGQLETLSEDPAERSRAIAIATSELDRMSRMVDDLLLLAKARQPEFLVYDLVDVAALTAEVHEKAAALADRRFVVGPTAAGTLVGDRQRLTQALIQLVQNAVDHTTTRGRIELGSSIEDGRARFWVHDDGPGVPPEVAHRVFDRFARAGARRSGGAGLGLAIVRAIAEGHGGRVWVESEPGEGATFTIEIPVDQTPPDPDVA
jgi:signal transduction histidine kinase